MVGVEEALIGVVSTARFSNWFVSTVSVSESEVLERDDIDGGKYRREAKLFVVTQNKKFPKILPWGEPPGTVLGWDNVLLIFTDICLLYKNAATKSIDVSLAPNSFKA